MSISKELIQELIDVLNNPDIPEAERFQLLHAGLAACAIKFIHDTGADSLEISSDFSPKHIEGKYMSKVIIERVQK